VSHEERNRVTAQAFKEMDTNEDHTLCRDDVEKYVRKYLVRGRETYRTRNQDCVGPVVDRLMWELDVNEEGIVTWENFSEWNRRNNIQSILEIAISSMDSPL